MTEQNPEDVTFRECMDYLEGEGIDVDIRVKVAGYFGTYGTEAWMRGLRKGVEAQNERWTHDD